MDTSRWPESLREDITPLMQKHGSANLGSGVLRLGEFIERWGYRVPCTQNS